MAGKKKPNIIDKIVTFDMGDGMTVSYVPLPDSYGMNDNWKPKNKLQTMGKSIFHITQEHMALMDTVMDNEGEMTEEMIASLQINEHELAEKSTSYVNLMHMLKTQNDGIKEEINRLNALKKSRESLYNRLSDVLLQTVNLHGDIKTDLHTITTRKSTSVEVEDVEKLDKAFRVVKITESADKNAIKEAIKNGVKVKGASLVENRNLSIK